MPKKWDAGACPVCLTGRTFHEECLCAAIVWVVAGQYDTDADAAVVRRLASQCYLCGTAKTTDAEHVHPVTRGGLDRWSNMAGACTPCNLDKSDRLDYMTGEQLARAAAQQEQFRAAFDRTTLDLAIIGVKYRQWLPEDLMPDGLLDLGLTQDAADRLFPDGPPKLTAAVRRSRYGFEIRL
jgi:hypothetical protein